MVKKSFLLIGATLLVVLCACSSDSGTSIPIVPEEDHPPYRTTPLGAWGGVQWSINEAESSGWENAIGSTFQYIPDPATAALYPGIFDSWDRAAEIEFVQSLFGADLELSAELIPVGFEQPTPVGAEVSWSEVNYWIMVEGEGGVCPVVFSGIANLEFRLEGNFWYLVSWEDVSGGSATWNPDLILPTLGQLRAVMLGQ